MVVFYYVNEFSYSSSLRYVFTLLKTIDSKSGIKSSILIILFALTFMLRNKAIKTVIPTFISRYYFISLSINTYVSNG